MFPTSTEVPKAIRANMLKTAVGERSRLTQVACGMASRSYLQTGDGEENFEFPGACVKKQNESSSYPNRTNALSIAAEIV